MESGTSGEPAVKNIHIHNHYRPITKRITKALERWYSRELFEDGLIR